MGTYNEDTLWETYDGRVIKLRELNNAHLANVLMHIRKLGCYPYALECAVADLARKRGLKEDLLPLSQIPHKDKNGDWAMMEYPSLTVKKLGGK
jgi:hypothetical protein